MRTKALIVLMPLIAVLCCFGQTSFDSLAANASARGEKRVSFPTPIGIYPEIAGVESVTVAEVDRDVEHLSLEKQYLVFLASDSSGAGATIEFLKGIRESFHGKPDDLRSGLESVRRWRSLL
jgi:hypothetical protein